MRPEDQERIRLIRDRDARRRHLRGELERIRSGAYAPLTEDERRSILNGGAPRLAVDPRKTSTLDVGQEVKLSSTMAIRIDKRSRTRQGEILFTYTIIDNRADYLLRIPPATKFETDEHGDPKPPTASAIRRAARESAYDGNPRDPLDAGRVVPPADQRAITSEAHQVEAVRDHARIGERVRAIEELPPLERVVALAELAKERGVDCREDIKAIERRLQRRLGLAA